MHYILRLTILLTLINKLVTTHQIQSTAFEEIRNGKRLVEGLLKILDLSSVTKCGLACNKNNTCRSFNFCGEKTCQLMSEDIFSTQKGEKILETDKNCKYIGMRRDSIPTCQKNGQPFDIRSNSSSEACQLMSKRVDREWAPWTGPHKIDEVNEWKVSWTREMLVDAAHGGLEGENQNKHVVSWLKFVYQEQSWEEAKKYCEDMNGELFSKLNGSSTQLQFLVKRMSNPGRFIWLGGVTEDHVVWKTVNNVNFDNTSLNWGLHQPNNYEGGQFCLALEVEFSYLNDNWCDWELTSICDML